MMGLLLTIFLLSVLSSSVVSDTISNIEDTKEYRNDIDTKVSSFLSSSDISSLPIHSRTVRNSSCPNVTEEEILHRFDMLDLHNQPLSIFLPVVTVRDTTLGTRVWRLPDRPWISGELLIRPYLNCLDQESEELAKIIKTDFLVPSDGQEYNFSAPLAMGGESGQPLDIDRLVFGGKLKNGFFIEAGSQDAETNSNTIHFELNHGWTGLLVEPHPLFFADGLFRHRNVSCIQTCLSISSNPRNIHFDMFGTIRKEDSEEVVAMSGLVTSPGKDTVEMQCLPLYSILMAMGNPTVHYFSLDIEGAELAVLKTIPWDKVDIKVLTVETHLAGKVFPGTREDIIQFLDSVGYRHLEFGTSGDDIKDDLFVKKGMDLLGEMVEEDKEIIGEKEREEL